MKKNILIICNDNTLLSKLAEAYLKNYAGFWKNVFSAGVHIKDKQISPYLKTLLSEDQLENKIEYTLKGIEEYDMNTIDYVIALTSSAFDLCKNTMPEKECILFILKTSNNQSEQSAKDVSLELKAELLRFVKNGPIKKWGVA